jgi:probable F420-dependent oxidoreductase
MVKIGLFALGIGEGARPRAISEIARNAERLNFATLWAAEHVVLFDQQNSRYPYSPTGNFPVAGHFAWLDPFLTLTYAGAATTKIRLATGICLVPEHNPLILAKQVATLDHLSGGRFALGVGIGWSAEEFQALGIPFEKRAQRTREYITVMRSLWREAATDFAGNFVQVKGARSYPKPISGDKLPVLFGGESDGALKRVASYGDGWYGFNLDPSEAAQKVKHLRELIKSNNRDPREVEIVVSPYTKSVEPAQLEEYREAGVDEVVLLMETSKSDEENVGRVEELARRWVEPAKALR